VPGAELLGFDLGFGLVLGGGFFVHLAVDVIMEGAGAAGLSHDVTDLVGLPLPEPADAATRAGLRAATINSTNIDEWDDEETDDPQSLGDDLPDRAPAIEAETDSLTPRGGLLLFLLVLPGAILLYLLLRNGGVEP